MKLKEIKIEAWDYDLYTNKLSPPIFRKYTCAKAFDGVLQTNRLGSAWASKVQGVTRNMTVQRRHKDRLQSLKVGIKGAVKTIHRGMYNSRVSNA